MSVHHRMLAPRDGLAAMRRPASGILQRRDTDLSCL